MRQRLYDFLQSRPEGATPGELLDLIFVGGVRDPDFGRRFLDTLLSGDERFRFEPDRRCWRASIHDVLGRALAETSFVVVDVETTGLAPGPDTITEIGAVRVEHGRLVEEFVSLVNPGRSIAPFVVQLTGITDAMVAEAPPIDEVLPRFVEFLGQRPLVAHNAKFDLGHLDAAAEIVLGRPLGVPVVCTLKLARRLRPQLRRRGLESVAADLGISFNGHHRARADARVTAEILCVFVEELARLGIGRLDQLLDFLTHAGDGRPLRVHVPRERLEGVPQTPGVYHLLGDDGRLLYVGRARRLRARLANYFNGDRGHAPKTLELIRQVRDVRVTETGSELAAALLEARHIRELKPPYNRLRRHLPRVGFVKLARRAPFPRLWVTPRLAPDRATYIGPFPSRQAAERAQATLARVFGVRTCTPPLRPAPDVVPCLLGEAGTCPAPCAARIDAPTYQQNAERLLAFVEDGDATIVHELARRRDALAAAGAADEAAAVGRDLALLEDIRVHQRTVSSIVGRQNFVVLLPTTDREAAQLYAVLGGRLALEARIAAATDLLAAVELVRERFDAFQGAPLAREHVESATIIAAWLRDRGKEGLLLPLAHRDDLAARLDELVVTVADLRQRGPLPVIDGLG